jgi:hypothetical protein
MTVDTTGDPHQRLGGQVIDRDHPNISPDPPP